MAAGITHALSLIILMAGTSLPQAEPMQGPGGEPHYAAYRIETAFLAVAEMPQPAEEAFPMAVKGDLPPGCIGPFRPDVQAECIDTAYEPGSDMREIVETRVGTTSILMRLHDFSGAAFVAVDGDDALGGGSAQ